MRREWGRDHDGSLVDVLYVDPVKLRDHAEACRVASESGATSTGDVKHLASIPSEIVEAWINARGIAFSDFMRDHAIQDRMLNDPDLACFRIYKGRVGS